METNVANLSWSQRFALIEHFEVSDETACEKFGIAQDALDAARELLAMGSIMPDNTGLAISEYGYLFEPPTKGGFGLGSLVNQLLNRNAIPTSSGNKTKVVGSSGNASQRQRGRRGNKIATAFANIPANPIPLDDFLGQYGVSINVIRQSRRFDTTGGGRIQIREIQGRQMIWRVPETAQKGND